STAACPAAPAPLPTLSFASPTTDAVSGAVAWEVTSPVAVNRIDFSIDGGGVLWSEYAAPFMYNGDPDGRLDTRTLSSGSHTLKADGFDAAGARIATGSKTVTVTNTSDTVAPTAPVALTVSAVSQSGMTLSWAASSDNVGVAGYRVYSNGAQLGQTTAT